MIKTKYYPWAMGAVVLYCLVLFGCMAIEDYFTQHGSTVRDQASGNVFPVEVNYGKTVFVTATESKVLPILTDLPYAFMALAFILIGLNERKGRQDESAKRLILYDDTDAPDQD